MDSTSMSMTEVRSERNVIKNELGISAVRGGTIVRGTRSTLDRIDEVIESNIQHTPELYLEKVR